MRFAIIGCGEEGSKRAAAIDSVEGAVVTVCVDSIQDRSEALAARYGAEVTTDWRAAIAMPDVDAVVIATANNLHSTIAVAAAEAGKHILCERPLARNASEAEQMVGAARDHGVKLKTGLNLRYHPVTVKARSIIEGGWIGKIVFMRGRTGRGSYLTPPAEWLVDCELAGGGTLLDNGYDLLDLCRYLMGDFRSCLGHTASLVYDIAPCDDNAFAVLTTADESSAIIHSSWTDWSSFMSIDISGAEGYITLDYDESTVVFGSRPGVTGARLEETFDLSTQPDDSLAMEIRELMAAVAEDREPAGSGQDGLEALLLARAIYRSSETGQAERV
jgi:predicted dehydrogenase